MGNTYTLGFLCLAASADSLIFCRLEKVGSLVKWSLVPRGLAMALPYCSDLPWYPTCRNQWALSWNCMIWHNCEPEHGLIKQCKAASSMHIIKLTTILLSYNARQCSRSTTDSAFCNLPKVSNTVNHLQPWLSSIYYAHCLEIFHSAQQRSKESFLGQKFTCNVSDCWDRGRNIVFNLELFKMVPIGCWLCHMFCRSSWQGSAVIVVPHAAL